MTIEYTPGELDTWTWPDEKEAPIIDWIDRAAEAILCNWRTWEAEAGQIAQNEQEPAAGERHLLECLTNKLRWLRANHEPTPKETT